MRLRECLGAGRLLQGDPETVITGVVYDSRRVEPGALFVAIPGFKVDGHDYVADAVARGAAAVVVEHPVSLPPEVAVLQVTSCRRALAPLAARFYRWPARKLRVVGVTGTNGKTTTTHLIRHILMEAGHKVGLIGTVHNFIGPQEVPSQLTTPLASDLQELMHRMVEAGCTYVVMEVSSEGLDMHRVDEVEFDIAVFTNLTQDHLNYHGTIENYRAAKMQLFYKLSAPGAKNPKAAILNMDDPSSGFFKDACAVPVWHYGMDPHADIRAPFSEVTCTSTGTRMTMHTPEGKVPMQLKLAGQFNVYNALAAAGACLAEGVELAVVQRALETATGVAGRMEAVNAGQPFGVFVDYAHSPDGLENVLRTAQGFATGRVIAVFGCGGDRDRTKRPQMGRIAAERSDYAIITSDNPRTEDPEAIARDIEAGFNEVKPPGQFYELIIDRAHAIERAVAIAAPGDVIIIAGKGHETYQIFRDRTIDFDDRAVARTCVEARMARKEGA